MAGGVPGGGNSYHLGLTWVRPQGSPAIFPKVSYSETFFLISLQRQTLISPTPLASLPPTSHPPKITLTPNSHKSYRPSDEYFCHFPSPRLTANPLPRLLFPSFPLVPIRTFSYYCPPAFLHPLSLRTCQGCDSITYAIPPFSHNVSSSSLFYQQPTTPVFPFPTSSCRYSPSPSSLESLQNCLHFLNVHSSLQSQQYDLCPHGPVETSLGQLSKNCLVK